MQNYRKWAIKQACLMLHSAKPSELCQYAEKLPNRKIPCGD